MYRGQQRGFRWENNYGSGKWARAGVGGTYEFHERIIGVLLWKFDQIFLKDKLTWGESQSRTQLSALSQAMEVEIKSISETMDLAMIALAAEHKDYPSTVPYGRFHMIAKLRAPKAQEWVFEDRYFREGTPTKS
jgi:hypothetical protein